MSAEKSEPTCPHCGAALSAFRVPEGMSWDGEIHWACFNDDCPYYQSGWEWMREQYNVKASYRYRIVAPDSTKCQPLAVPDAQALRDRIVEKP